VNNIREGRPGIHLQQRGNRVIVIPRKWDGQTTQLGGK